MPRPIHAKLELPSNPEMGTIDFTIDRIADIVDPTEHMALLVGSVGNADGNLKIDQFATATVDIGFDHGVVEIPATALVDDSDESYVFIQPDPEVQRFACRRVSVVSRHSDVVHVPQPLDRRGAQGRVARSASRRDRRLARRHRVARGSLATAGGQGGIVRFAPRAR